MHFTCEHDWSVRLAHSDSGHCSHLSLTAGHCLPPKAASLVTWRNLARAHLSTELLTHVLHLLHLVALQLTGQGWALQRSDKMRLGHAFPPKTGCVRIFLLAWRTPPPQDLSHTVHADSGPTLQSTGQAFFPQTLELCKCWHGLPR